MDKKSIILYKLYYTNYTNYTILYYTIPFLKLKVKYYTILSKIKQFYHPRSEDSLQSLHMVNQGGFFASLVASFAFISRDYY